jgi:glycosyltransferase involved in cell wall biosynthesis
MQEIIPILQENGVKVVIDMDDSLSTIHPRNRAFQAYDPRTSHRMNWIHAQKACDMADLVTVTTQALAEEYGKHGRVSVIPNHIPEAYLKIQRPLNEVPVVGWAGWTQNHPDDLNVTRGAINQVLIDTGAVFAAFGDPAIFSNLGMRLRPPHVNWGFTSVHDYPKTLVRFDIGLVPLAKGPFNEAKSWLKGLEYASLGVVPVVTPTPDYQNLIDLGIALPASTPREWADQVRLLIQDNEMRQEMSEKCRAVAADWTIEGNAHKWWEAWQNEGRNY